VITKLLLYINIALGF